MSKLDTENKGPSQVLQTPGRAMHKIPSTSIKGTFAPSHCTTEGPAVQVRKEKIMSRTGTRAAQGSGTIRKKTVTRQGREYTYWEARCTVGRDPGTGRQIQRSFTGKTQKEVREKLQAVVVEVNEGTYTPPCKLTVGEWLDIWTADYLVGVKPNTVRIYTSNVNKHIKPAMAAVPLDRLHPHMIQRFINRLELSPSSVRLAYKVLYQALDRAVTLGYLIKNPAAGCELPRQKQTEIKPMEDQQTAVLLKEAKGTPMEQLVTLALFTGCRLSELLGLTWDCVDFDNGSINICKQLNRAEHRGAAGMFLSPKNGKSRIIAPAPSVFSVLREQRRIQAEMQLRAGAGWDNPYGLVFTGELGGPLEHWTAEQRFSSLVKKAGLDGVRFHDLRHTYAVNSIRAGDDIKTIQGNLGHATAAFTLDRYGHFTEAMKRDSAQRMEGFMKSVLSV